MGVPGSPTNSGNDILRAGVYISMSFLVRSTKKLKSPKPCYSFEVLISTSRGEIETSGWRYWPDTAHIEPPSVPTHGFYKPIIKAPNTVREELLAQLRYLNVGAKDTQPTPKPTKKEAAKPIEEEPIWEEYGYSRDEWYALPDDTVVAQEALPKRCEHVVRGGKLLKRPTT